MPGFQLYLIILVVSSEVTADVSSLGLSGWAWTDLHPQHSHFLHMHYVLLAPQVEGSKDLKGCSPDGLWGGWGGGQVLSFAPSLLTQDKTGQGSVWDFGNLPLHGQGH